MHDELCVQVLGMTDRVREPSHTDTFTTRTSLAGSHMSSAHLGDGAPVIAPVTFEPHAGGKKQAPPVPPHRASAGSVRLRAGSDPFLEPHEKHSARNVEHELLEPVQDAAPASPLSPSVPLLAAHVPLSPSAPPLPLPLPPAAAPSATQYRTFTLAPYLSNPELRALCRLFPPFISSPARSAARFPTRRRTPPVPSPAQVEAGVAGEDEVVAQVGHGELRVGQARRDEGWGGTWWERLVLWLRSLFGLV